MEEIFGVIDSIVFSDEESGFVIGKIKEPKKPEVTLILGTLFGVHIGETIHAKGLWKIHPKFGKQFEIKEFETKRPTTVDGIAQFLSSGIKGIGPKWAKKIVAHLGEETLNIIDHSPEKLLKIEGFGKKKLAKILASWKEQSHVRTVMVFLRGNGVTPSLAQKIYKTYGDEAIAKMEENPYRVAQEIRGIGFKSADMIAKNLGIKNDAPQRIQSGIQHLLWELSSEGHVCYPIEELTAAAIDLLSVDQKGIESALIQLKQEEVIVEEDGMLFIKPLFLTEVGISKQIARLLEAPCALRGVDVPKALEWVQERLRLRLAKEQQTGVAKAVSEKMLILTGGPGTGKSTITKAILRITEKLSNKILLAAPTGRAAKRMSEITYKKAFTIHSLLEMDFKNGGFKKGLENPLKCDLLIVDEASMIDTMLMNSLLKAIPTHARVIFVGDIDQLPSVGPGNVLRDLIDSSKVPVVRLKEIFRQARGSDIITNSHKIKEGRFPWLEGKKDFFFYEANSQETIQQTLLDLMQKQLDDFDPLRQVQILSPMKRGLVGTENLNTLMQSLLNPSNHPLMKMGRRFHLGDKVMQLRNNYQKEVFNGDVGYICQIDEENQLMQVEFYGKVVDYDFSEFDELVLAYAVSIHKYQGSESPVVIIPIDVSHFKLLYRNLLYTGITRGKKRVILIGSKKAIAIAVRTEEVQKRHTGLLNQLTKIPGHQGLLL